jgi:hypothetical protein
LLIRPTFAKSRKYIAISIDIKFSMELWAGDKAKELNIPPTLGMSPHLLIFTL